MFAGEIRPFIDNFLYCNQNASIMTYGVTNSGKFDISSKKVFGRKKGVWQQTN
jgi:hypothetical protein